MEKYPKKVCENCWWSFSPKKKWQITCCLKCYQELVKKRTKQKKELSKNSFPDFKCPKCWTITTLTFSPISDIKSWKKFKCKCWYTRSWDDSIY